MLRQSTGDGLPISNIISSIVYIQNPKEPQNLIKTLIKTPSQQPATMKSSLSLPLVLAALSAASPAKRATNQTFTPNCHDLMLNVSVTATNYKLDVPRVDSNADVGRLVDELDRRTAPNTTQRIIGKLNITDTFSIYAQLCLPEPAQDKHVLQILSHGGAFDHRYFAAEIDPAQYSYVYAAVMAGYTVLNYDRLGNGLSQKPDAYDIVQGAVSIEILHSLTKMARDGTLLSASIAGYPSLPSTLPPLAPFDKVVHVGHSLGSQTTAAFLKRYGAESSGAILTGFTFPLHSALGPAGIYSFEYAASNNPALYGALGSGYIVPSSPTVLQSLFFHRNGTSDPTGFTDEALAYGESIKQPFAIGDALSARGLLDFGYSPSFAGPLQFFLGEFDYLVCGGDCKGNFDPDYPKSVYPNATAIETYVQPGAGHGNVLHLNANAGYAVSLKFLEENGL
ncbi:Uu.00g001550.m01.CDS01 [Anthostomella pinea]|uniref:Uu.00g001550.m01.CDS01 n=1 Tax=Anthostomella pinea TaxID=933095 RepID=A0AAI8VKD3_9PEZI|nr:Uu.00g001550.m01.CDS01 [Anthostomella pinea]